MSSCGEAGGLEHVHGSGSESRALVRFPEGTVTKSPLETPATALLRGGRPCQQPGVWPGALSFMRTAGTSAVTITEFIADYWRLDAGFINAL